MNVAIGARGITLAAVAHGVRGQRTTTRRTS